VSVIDTAIESVTCDERSLVVRWADGASSRYPWLWLRDHDTATLHPVTQQRQLFTAGIDPALRGATVAVDGNTVHIVWDGDEPASDVDVALLGRHRAPATPTLDVAVERVLWDAETISMQWPTVAFDDVMAGDEGVARWLERVARYGFCIVVGTPPTIDDTRRLIERVGYVRETIFGGMWDFQADLAKADTAYTNVELLPHTDGTYSHDAPGLQLLHCLAFDGEGGLSTMVDGYRIAAELRRDQPELYDVLARVDVPGQYIGDGVHLMAGRPILRHDARGELVQVSFNNADRAPFLLPDDGMDEFYAALRAFEALANDERLQWRRANPPGEAMLFDNWRVLHGRTAYSGHRHLCGGYVNREDYESRLRLALAAR
jgi:trimethyllysine dioxygenase